MSTDELCNIAAVLPEVAARQPHTLAVVFPDGRDARGKVRYTHYTYAQLDRDSDRLAAACDRRVRLEGGKLASI